MSKLSDSKVAAVTSQNYTGVATAGQTVITPGFNWRTVWTGQALYISGVKQAPNSYTVNSIGSGLSSQITLSEALVGGETIDFTALDISAVPSLQGIVDTLALQPTQITNAGMGVWSNGTLESAVSSVNLITNGEFETDTSGWTAGNSATLTRDTTTSVNGSACLKVTNPGSTVYGRASTTAATIVGHVYKLVAYVKSNGVNIAYVNVGTLDGGNEIATQLVTQSSYTKIEVLFEAVSTTTYISCINSNVASLSTYYDSITLYDMGANLVTNGTFNSNTTGWTTNNAATLSSVSGGINGNALSVSGVSYGVAYQQITGLTVGKLYRVSGWIKGTGSVAGFIEVGAAIAGAELGAVSNSTSSFVYGAFLFEATATSVYLTLNNSVTASAILYDSITLTEVIVGCTDYNTKALDLWTKDTGAQCWRDQINTKSGSYYALRVYNGAVYWSDGGRSANPEFYARYAGRAAAIGVWVRCSSANKARIGITDSAGTTWSNYHSGGGSYEWLEVTRTPGTGITSFNVVVDSGTGTQAQFSQPQLMFGTSVGSGNFVPILNEIIRFPSFYSQKYNAMVSSTVAATLVNVLVDSGGRLGKGTRQLFVEVYPIDSNFGIFLANSDGSATNNQCQIEAFSYAMKYPVQIPCSQTGDYYILLTASGTSTLTTSVQYTGVQL